MCVSGGKQGLMRCSTSMLLPALAQSDRTLAQRAFGWREYKRQHCHWRETRQRWSQRCLACEGPLRQGRVRSLPRQEQGRESGSGNRYFQHQKIRRPTPKRVPWFIVMPGLVAGEVERGSVVCGRLESKDKWPRKASFSYCGEGREEGRGQKQLLLASLAPYFGFSNNLNHGPPTALSLSFVLHGDGVFVSFCVWLFHLFSTSLSSMFVCACMRVVALGVGCCQAVVMVYLHPPRPSFFVSSSCFPFILSPPTSTLLPLPNPTTGPGRRNEVPVTFAGSAASAKSISLPSSIPPLLAHSMAA